MNAINLTDNVKRAAKHVKTGVKTTVATAAAGATLLAFTAVPYFTIELINTSASQSLPKLMDIKIDSVDNQTGDFSGEVATDGNQKDIWEVVGTVQGSKIEFQLESLRTSERIIATGDVDPNGDMTGIAADTSGSKYEWEKAS